MEIKTENVLYLIGGPNGSGKTTLVHQLFGPQPEIAFLNCDNIARDRNLGQNGAGIALLRQMENIFSSHDSFVFETTLSDKFHNRLIRRAHDAGYSIEFFYVVLSSVEQNLARVRARFANGGHNVPDHVILRRHNKSLFNFDTVYKLSDHWCVYNNSGTECKLFASGFHDVINVLDNGLYNAFVKYKGRVVADYLADIEKRRIAKLRPASCELSK